MPEFESLFREAKGNPVQYKGFEIKRIDKFPVKNGDVLVCSIEHAIEKLEYLQGFCIDVTGHCELNGQICREGKGIRMIFWYGHTPPEFKLKIFTKYDFVVIYNICEVDNSFIASDESGNCIKKHSKYIDAKYNGAAMIVEEIEGGRRYRCSDTSSAEKSFPFNDIVFTVKKI
ncbi:MAG: hypothetical protein A3F67_07780 [Verrucomicrobia bacterium RIFCSPHIGHO2_12_FULL_41_10]|nr:MAG: hypothetical protein A3F67_07780 [Verrucomicrobia bacterium RIFCSPHIGHO2_12_FULL_41_10]